MSLVPRKRSRVFHLSVLFAFALVILEFVAPRATLQFQRDSVINGTSAINNRPLYQSNASLEESIGSVTSAQATKPSSGFNTEMTDTMTQLYDNESKVDNADNSDIRRESLSNGTLSVSTENEGAAQAKVSVVTAKPSNLRANDTDSTKLTTRNSTISLRGSATFSVVETKNIKARLASLRKQTQNATKQRKKAIRGQPSMILNKLNTTAGFIHLGKTGGSTISILLRNGCHSFVKKPCHNVPNETIVSELVTNYYHTPDLDLIPRSKHDLYFVSIRDPLERLISAFAYLHPKNILARKERSNGIPLAPNKAAYKCFPTLEKFANDVGTSGGYCNSHAKRAVGGRVKIMSHLYSNYHKMVAPIPADAQVYVFRNEHIWEDWEAVNKLLDPNRTVVIPTGKKVRDVTNVKQPVSRDLSSRGRDYLCRAIQQEYEVFFSLLKRAVNLNETDIQDARDTANKNCPNLVAPRVSLIGSKKKSKGSIANRSSTPGLLSDRVERPTESSPIQVARSETSFLALTHNYTKTAGFIHVGKCGGSSLTSQLRNGCHSFVKKPCSVIANETAISELVTDYYHIPDVERIPESRHDVYFVTSRDPLERVISAFVYLHPRNRNARNETGNGIPTKANQMIYQCFPTVERFASFLGRNDNSECSVRARRAVNGEIKLMNHLWANYKKMVAPIHFHAKVYVIRKEHMWHDWNTINEMLEPNKTVILPTGDTAHGRDMTNVNQPVTRDLSDRGRENLCRAIEQEYEIFFSLLNRAVNLNATDIQEAREKAHTNCPNLMEPRVSLRGTVTQQRNSSKANQIHSDDKVVAAQPSLKSVGRPHVGINDTGIQSNT